MSIKLHEGLRAPGPFSSAGLGLACSRVASSVLAACGRGHAGLFLDGIRDVVDAAFLKGPAGDGMVCMEVVDRLKKNEKEINGDFDFALMVFPMPRGDVLLLPFHGGADGYDEAVALFPGVGEYGYWDNTDRPKGVGSREWAARRRAWEKALTVGGRRWRAPADCGLSVAPVTALNPYAQACMSMGELAAAAERPAPDDVSRIRRMEAEIRFMGYRDRFPFKGGGTSDRMAWFRAAGKWPGDDRVADVVSGLDTSCLPPLSDDIRLAKVRDLPWCGIDFKSVFPGAFE